MLFRSDLYGRRAALQAVAVIGAGGGDEDIRAALAGAWGRHPGVSLCAAQAAAWAGRYDAMPAVLASANSESANWRRSSAVALGGLFDRSYPARLDPPTTACNPTRSYRPIDVPPTDPGTLNPDGPAAAGTPVGWPDVRVERLVDPFLAETLWP